MFSNITHAEYMDYVSRVLELLPNENTHSLSLLGVSFYDESDIANGVNDPVAEVKSISGGFYVTLFGDTLVKGVTESEAFDILIEELEAISTFDPIDPTGEFTRGGNP